MLHCSRKVGKSYFITLWNNCQIFSRSESSVLVSYEKLYYLTKTCSKRVRTRYAPSPTGFLHLGGLRTALFNYLWAKKNDGDFVLRIEDTDQTRIVAGAEKNFIDCLNWASIPFNEGPGKENENYRPYRQSERVALYLKYAEQLLENGYAYRCFCTPQRLQQMRDQQERRGVQVMYDRHCLRLTTQQIKDNLERGVPYTIRLKVPEGTTVVEDLLVGTVKYNNKDIDDQVLIKSDKFPTYHLANVVDDHLMDITHVIRGEVWQQYIKKEWLPSTPKHVILYKAFGWEMPQFVHLPLLLNKNKTKLSKRQGDVSVTHYIESGYLPEAVVNFVALLGWNPGLNNYKEVFTLDELIDAFSLEQLNKGGAIVNIDKLNWLNTQHIKRLAIERPSELSKRFLPFLRNNVPAATEDVNYITKVLSKINEFGAAATLKDIAVQLTYIFGDVTLENETAQKQLTKLLSLQSQGFSDICVNNSS
jgi:glutamyl-tRNA synthetase